VRQRLKSLDLHCQIRERGCHPRLKLLCRFGVGTLPNLVLASGNKECLLGTEAAFFDSGANLIPQLGGRVSKIARKALFIHETPLSRVVPQWHHFLFEVVPRKAKEIEVVKPEKGHEVAPTLYVPIPAPSADDPPVLHAKRSYCCRRAFISDEKC
jgi:hypothetical protein